MIHVTWYDIIYHIIYHNMFIYRHAVLPVKFILACGRSMPWSLSIWLGGQNSTMLLPDPNRCRLGHMLLDGPQSYLLIWLARPPSCQFALLCGLVCAFADRRKDGPQSFGDVAPFHCSCREGKSERTYCKFWWWVLSIVAQRVLSCFIKVCWLLHSWWIFTLSNCLTAIWLLSVCFRPSHLKSASLLSSKADALERFEADSQTPCLPKM